MLQEDASEDGAATQQQGKQTDEGHQHVKELPCVALSWHNRSQMREVTENKEY